MNRDSSKAISVNKWQLISQSFVQAAPHSVVAAKSSWPLLLGVYLGISACKWYFLSMLEIMPDNIAAQLGVMMVSLLREFFIVILIPLRVFEQLNTLPRASFWDFTKKHALPLTLESLRAFAHILLWTLALIVPGFIKYLRYSFVPYVVMFDKEYENDHVDALHESNRLVKGMTLEILIILVVFTLVSFLLDSLGSSSIAGLLVSGLLTMAVSVYSYAFMFLLYFKRRQGHKGEESHESAV